MTSVAVLHPLEETFAYSFRDKHLLQEALTHPSLRRNNAQAKVVKDFERLEFLGDAVLGLVVAEMLFTQYPEEREGDLARRQAALVCGEVMAEVAVEWRLGDYIHMTEGEEATGGRESMTNLEDVCEALIGALFLDGGLEVVRPVVLKAWKPLAATFAHPPKDPRNALQEWAQGRGLPLPEYTVLQQSGPAHSPEFTIQVQVEGCPPERVRAGSKKLAMRDAAEQLLQQLAKAGKYKND